MHMVGEEKCMSEHAYAHARQLREGETRIGRKEGGMGGRIDWKKEGARAPAQKSKRKQARQSVC